MIKTARLRLRNFLPADAEVMQEYRSTQECSEYQRYAGTGIEYLRSFIKNFSASSFPSTEEEQHYAIAELSSNGIVGDLSVFFSERDRCFTLGITVSPAHQRNGYAYEILSSVISKLKASYPEAEQVALIDRENEKSISLFKKLGFKLECYAESVSSYVFVK